MVTDRRGSIADAAATAVVPPASMPQEAEPVRRGLLDSQCLSQVGTAVLLAAMAFMMAVQIVFLEKRGLPRRRIGGRRRRRRTL